MNLVFGFLLCNPLVFSLPVPLNYNIYTSSSYVTQNIITIIVHCTSIPVLNHVRHSIIQHFELRDAAEDVVGCPTTVGLDDSVDDVEARLPILPDPM